jgi:uncharacterized membrane protein AbrB (regulator of aidB expression)
MLDIIGFVFIIVVTIFAYKTAKDYERNAIGWALITFAVGIGIQIILPAFILVIIAIAATVGGSSTQKVQDDIPFVTISIICIVLSIVAGFLILRHLAKIPEEKSFNTPPEPPLDFNQNN